MSIPEKTTVLVIGGGPGGSYTAAALAREGFNVVILEADQFPRYHIGESVLPSFRHYLKFIELDQEFDRYGFTKKVGAAFKLSADRQEGYTDFIARGGPGNYSWNLIRSEADELILRHAGKSGAKIFEGVKVNSIEFALENGSMNGTNGTNGNESAHIYPGRPVSASYTRKEDGLTGVIKFDYIVDASGRAGLISTKYLKNRRYNAALKNVASWAYWKGTGVYKPGTDRENAPVLEALRDETGWVWYIPLHDGTTSIGIVQNQEKAKKAKQATSSPQDYYKTTLKLAGTITSLIGDGKQTSDLGYASDYSYNASIYAFPNARIVGDAGCFIDPFFSSGVHIALTGALSAATTIAAAIRGDCTEEVAADWHTNKIKESYTRFLLAVLSVYKQMQHQDSYILSDFGEENFDKAFSFFRPIIQGTSDTPTDKLTQTEFSKTINYLTQAFTGPGAPGIDGKVQAPAPELTSEDRAMMRSEKATFSTFAM